MLDAEEEETQWRARRLELIEELSPTIRALHPGATWKEMAALVESAADTKLLYERFGREP